MVKLLLILFMSGALANGSRRRTPQPPLLIDPRTDAALPRRRATDRR